MMRLRIWALSVLSGALFSCNGTTGYQLVTFYAAARGFPDAIQGHSYSFTAPGGARVTLTEGSLHIGALYLTQAVPQPGAGPAPCELPQTYEGAFVGEVRGDADIDLLNPSKQKLPATGKGSTLASVAGQVWLVHNAALSQGNLNGTDASPVLTLRGSYEAGGVVRTFSVGLSIDTSRIIAKNTGLPGQIQICEKRIISGIPAQVGLAQGGTLVVEIDASALFSGVPFTDLPNSSAGSAACAPGAVADVCFTDDDSNLSSRALFANLTAIGPYRFGWLTSGG